MTMWGSVGFSSLADEREKGGLSGRYISANWDVEDLEGMKEEVVKGDKLKMRMVV